MLLMDHPRLFLLERERYYFECSFVLVYMYDSVHLTDRYLLQISGNGHLYQYTEFQ